MEPSHLPVHFFVRCSLEQEIEWARLRELLLLAEKAAKNYDPKKDNVDDKRSVSRQTLELFFKFLTSRTGVFMKKPLINELSEAIDGMASIGEANLLRVSRGLIRPLPGGNGPVNSRRMDELRAMLDVMQSALSSDNDANDANPNQEGRERVQSMMEFLREMIVFFSDEQRRAEFTPLLDEILDVFQQVAIRVLEIRGSRAVRNILQLSTASPSAD